MTEFQYAITFRIGMFGKSIQINRHGFAFRILFGCRDVQLFHCSGSRHIQFIERIHFRLKSFKIHKLSHGFRKQIRIFKVINIKLLYLIILYRNPDARIFWIPGDIRDENNLKFKPFGSMNRHQLDSVLTFGHGDAEFFFFNFP